MQYQYFFIFFCKDERSDKRNQILQKAVANWLNSEGSKDSAFMVGEFIFFGVNFFFFFQVLTAIILLFSIVC